MKIKITLVKIGYIDRFVDLKKIMKWRSGIFDIIEIQAVDYLPDSEMYDTYLDQKFTRDDLREIFSCPAGSNFAVAITSYRFIDNFYMHRIAQDRVGISLYGIPEILGIENISIENFIIKCLYEICAISLIADISNDAEVYGLIHRDTRGCLFDMNGDRTDILYNTEKPIICSSCTEKFNRNQTRQGIIPTFNKELRKIRKSTLLIIEGSIRKYPLFSIVLGALIGSAISSLFTPLFEILMVLINTLS